MEYKNLLCNVDAGIATIVLNRPKALNALNKELMGELGQALDRIAGDDQTGAVIITGGNKVFAAGADITAMLKANPVEARVFGQIFHQVFTKITMLPKPVIAAIAGPALGGGCELALACDLRIATVGAKFGLPEINLGIIPGGGGTQRLARLIGMARAKKMIFTGEVINVEEAKWYGLVNSVVPEDKLQEEAGKLAATLAQKPRLAMTAAKKAINNGLNADLAIGCLLEQECFAGLFATEDQQEGMQAFIEKRRAEFKNC